MGNFLEAVARFKTKYEVISKTLKISSTNYNSLKELEEASNKLVELEKALGEQKNDEDFLKAKAIVKDHIEEQEEKLLKYAALKEKLERGDNLTTEEIQLKKEYEEKEKREKKLSEFKKEFGLDKEIKNTEKRLIT